MKESTILFITVMIMGLTQDFATAQNKTPGREAAYFQIGGDGITIVSLNYDRTLAGPLQGRVGLGYSYAVGDIEILDHNYLVSLPMQASYLMGGDNNFFEITGGITPTYLWGAGSGAKRESEFTVVPSLFVGYRHQPLGNGFLFRVNLGAGYDREGIHPAIGLSFGFVIN
ncbi:hypothetical protein [Fodinibius salsisoli]|uniref:Outer membrane protein beta-barrel domain-containing protein n=1 Tax=Fodinibius salsisoli TaxID=2820877 RepID=A0ABT3PHN5_9BACT|nr:hypothetical protein [Fodinibius salsisoli]MCW9705436.1 hypothetical protein [Fodinibius salsisoli]